MALKLVLALAILSPCVSFAEGMDLYKAKTPIRTRPRARKVAHGQFCNENNALIEWQCGGRPAGSGWVRVDAVCFHRDTGRECY